MTSIMIDWHTWQWRHSAGGERTWRLTVSSDWAPLNDYEAVMLDDPEAVYGDLLELLRTSDLNVTNIEAVLATSGMPIPKDGPPLRGDPRTVRALTEANVGVACLANNHIMDYGPEGFRRTLDVLGEAGIETVGAGFNESLIRRPLLREVHGVKVAIINCAEGEEGRSVRGEPGVHGLDIVAVLGQIAELKKGGKADVVVVIFHGGREYTSVPAPYVVRQLRQLAEGGADAVVAHHPHVPQATEIHHGVPITYSPGNFVFWLGVEYLYQRIGYLVHLDFAGSQLAGVALTPYVLQPMGLQMMREPMRAWFSERMAAASAPLASMHDVWLAWAAFADSQGCESLLDHLKKVIDALKSGQDVPKWSAKLRNAFFTPAHHELYSELLSRVTREACGTTPAWAQELVRTWSQAQFEELADLAAGQPE